jgi:hypothetical protein
MTDRILNDCPRTLIPWVGSPERVFYTRSYLPTVIIFLLMAFFFTWLTSLLLYLMFSGSTSEIRT